MTLCEDYCNFISVEQIKLLIRHVMMQHLIKKFNNSTFPPVRRIRKSEDFFSLKRKWNRNLGPFLSEINSVSLPVPLFKSFRQAWLFGQGREEERKSEEGEKSANKESLKSKQEVLITISESDGSRRGNHNSSINLQRNQTRTRWLKPFDRDAPLGKEPKL